MGRFRTPGPGSYENPSFLTISGGKSAGAGAAFNSGSTRSGMLAASSGDPGSYDLDHVGVHMGSKEPMGAKTARSFNREANRGRASFNSSTPRSTSAPRLRARGGPGEHDYSHMYSCGKAGQGMTSSFRSSSPLAGHIRKSSTPGVGSYDPHKGQSQESLLSSQSAKSMSKDGSSMFAGVGPARIVKGSGMTGDHVGPGSYELDASSLKRSMQDKLNPRLPAFGSSNPRPDELY